MRLLNHHYMAFNGLQAGSCDLESYLTALDLPVEKADTLVSELSECKCCSRHSSFRPPCLIPGDCLPTSPTSDAQGGTKHDKAGCQCPCRHYSRILCRSYGHLSDIAISGEEEEEVVPAKLTKPEPAKPEKLPPIPPLTIKMAMEFIVN